MLPQIARAPEVVVQPWQSEMALAGVLVAITAPAQRPMMVRMLAIRCFTLDIVFLLWLATGPPSAMFAW
ncbi:hypothetical protein AVL48_14680 [Amycolatopsis regifaucium]|uniref:Uncharacterized protein n=1 Tax=Amycolatopsis regifaucium TaxID=546365 RepID=A0A154M4U2_9PSEU|nr:hypothetical protein AVL48_14680 [Amycolatopsis regifaucium]